MPFHSIPFHSIPLALHSIPLSFHSVTRCKFSIFLASSVRLASAGCAKRKQCAGVPPPAWLDPAFLEVWGRRPYREGSARPVEGHRRTIDGPSTAYRSSFKNSSWAPSWLQVRIFSQFVCIFFARCFEVAFFIVS